MDFSHDWKSLWPVASVFRPPLLLGGGRSPEKSPLGPLLFVPSCHKTTLLSSLFLSPQFPSTAPAIPSAIRSFIPPYLLPSLADDALFDPSPPPPLLNSLTFLPCRNRDFLAFFPAGENSDTIGFFVISSEGRAFRVNSYDGETDFFIIPQGRRQRITKIFASAAEDGELENPSDGVLVEGFLLACTLYTAHWFRIETRVSDGCFKKPLLVHVGFAEFRAPVLHASWSPHLREESVVMLESGEFLFFDFNSCDGVWKLPVKLRGARVGISWDNVDGFCLGKGGIGWLGCEFAWHPRVLIVAHSSAVFLLDLRHKESKVTVLAKVEMCDSIRVQSVETTSFVAFSKARYDHFYFSVATEYDLLLFDTRQPLVPVLQWDHTVDTPNYIDMFKLSELRPSPKDGEFSIASGSGYAILLGSFWNSEFCLFCYGTSLPSLDSLGAQKISKFGNALYAWGLPSELSLCGDHCGCGNCLVKEEFAKSTFPVGIHWQQKKEIVLGFFIITDNFLHDDIDSRGLGGFTLIRLMSSGKLESQRYKASWDFQIAKPNCQEAFSSCFRGSFLYSRGQEDYFSTRFRSLKLDYLVAYLNGKLDHLVDFKMQTEGRSVKNLSNKFRGLLSGSLKVEGDSQFFSNLAISDIIAEVSFPTNIHEIACRVIWAGLSLDLLELAFTNYSDLIDNQMKATRLEFLVDVPNFSSSPLPQLFSRKPSRKGGKWSNKTSHGDDVLIGPMLPLPFLHTLQHIYGDRNNSDVEEGVNDISAKQEVTHLCNEVMTLSKDLICGNQEKCVSLADDNGKWDASQELQVDKTFFLYKSQMKLGPNTLKGRTCEAGLVQEPTPEDEKFVTFVSQKRKKSYTPNGRKEALGLEMFDDLCPVQLCFDSPSVKFSSEEAELFKCLERQFSKWQDDFKPYKDFCASTKES